MALTIATLADGQLPLSKTAIFTVATGYVAHVRVVVVNADSSTRTVNLYVKRAGGTSRRIIAKDKSLAAGSDAISFPPAPFPDLKLSDGDAIEGDASAATAVDYLIFGAIEPTPV